jgi:hypothetical protein
VTGKRRSAPRLAWLAFCAALPLAGCAVSAGQAIRPDHSAGPSRPAVGVVARDPFRGRFTDGQPCPRASYPGVPANSGCIGYALGDFEGDGRRGAFVVYAHPLDRHGFARAWHASITLKSGRIAVAALPWPGFGLNLWVLGAANADGDGADEAIVRVGGGASTDLLGVFLLRNGSLIEVRKTDGRPFVFTFGSTVLFGSGGGCRRVGARMELVDTGAGIKGGRWHWNETFYRWQSAQVTPARILGGTTTSRGARRYEVFQCGDVNGMNTSGTSTLLGQRHAE